MSLIKDGCEASNFNTTTPCTNLPPDTKEGVTTWLKTNAVTDPETLFTYDTMKAYNSAGRIAFMAHAYRCAAKAMNIVISNTELDSDDNRQLQIDQSESWTQSANLLEQALLDNIDGIPTNDAELMSTFLGGQRDALDCNTRRSRPLGTIIKEMDAWIDGIEVGTTSPESTFEVGTVLNDLPDVSFTDIVYKESKTTEDDTPEPIIRTFNDFKGDSNKDLYDEEHKTCLAKLPCTYEEPSVEVITEDIKVDDLKELAIDVDVGISDKDITTGCANGDGLFDKFMSSIDSSITLQAKAGRITPANFGNFYASVISSSMQQAINLEVDKKKLLLEDARLDLAVAEYNLKAKETETNMVIAKEKAEYDIALAKAQTEKVLLEVEKLKKEIPLELALLTQQVKNAERTVELTEKNVEVAESQTNSNYSAISEERKNNTIRRALDTVSGEKILKDIKETTANGEVNRNLTEANIENTRVNTKVAKFEVQLKKEQVYQTRVRTAEEKATGASQRRVASSDVQSKNKMASLYNQQRKLLISKDRQDAFSIAKDMWSYQIDNVGAENMVVEGVKGAIMSSKLERLLLDSGL